MGDARSLGQVLHEARIEHNPKTERPRVVAPWDERAPWQQELDEKMAAAVEAEVRRRIAHELWLRAEDHTIPGERRNAWYAAAEAVKKGSVS